MSGRFLTVWPIWFHKPLAIRDQYGYGTRAMNPLKSYREIQQISQRELAERLNVSRMTVIRWETGKRKIDVGLVPQISKKTGLSPAELRPDLVELLA